jgi:hypothetical protein
MVRKLDDRLLGGAIQRRYKKLSAPKTRMKYHGDFSDSILSKLVFDSLQEALLDQGKLPDWIVSMDGMSGIKYRLFINNLISRLETPRYLEIGSWSGSTACSAIYGNSLSALCIDNWSGFGGPKQTFAENISRASDPNCNFQFIEADFRSIDFKDLQFNANVYLFDGPHEEQDQYDGIRLAIPSLQSEFILIVDDFNSLEVRSGTERAIRDHTLSIQSSIEIRTTRNGSQPLVHSQNSDWHNGYFLAHLKQERPNGVRQNPSLA